MGRGRGGGDRRVWRRGMKGVRGLDMGRGKWGMIGMVMVCLFYCTRISNLEIIIPRIIPISSKISISQERYLDKTPLPSMISPLPPWLQKPFSICRQDCETIRGYWDNPREDEVNQQAAEGAHHQPHDHSTDKHTFLRRPRPQQGELCCASPKLDPLAVPRAQNLSWQHFSQQYCYGPSVLSSISDCTHPEA